MGKPGAAGYGLREPGAAWGGLGWPWAALGRMNFFLQKIRHIFEGCTKGTRDTKHFSENQTTFRRVYKVYKLYRGYKIQS